MTERVVGIIDIVKGVIQEATSADSRRLYREMGSYLYVISRWGLAAVLHPVSTYKAVMLIGDQQKCRSCVKPF